MSIFLTVAAICVLATANFACGPIVNDWSGHTKAPQSSYRTTQAPGQSAADLLSSANFNKLTVEIQAIRGFEPSQDTLTHLQRFLEARADKPGGVTITINNDLAAAPTGPAYSTSDLRALENHNRRLFPQKDEFTVYVLMLDGSSAADSGDTKHLGQAYGNASIAIFENTIRTEAAKIQGLPVWTAEATVLEHEFGHLFGLVHYPIADQSKHEDPNHPAHCQHSGCLMYYTSDTSALLSGLTGGQPLALEQDCLDDLKNAGGK